MHSPPLLQKTVKFQDATHYGTLLSLYISTLLPRPLSENSRDTRSVSLWKMMELQISFYVWFPHVLLEGQMLA